MGCHIGSFHGLRAFIAGGLKGDLLRETKRNELGDEAMRGDQNIQIR